MKSEMKAAQAKLQKLLDAHPITEGAYVRVHGKNLIIGRFEPFGPNKETIHDDRVRLTRISKRTYGLSIRRHTGRWEKIPFSGTMEQVVTDMLQFMQHLLTSYNQ